MRDEPRQIKKTLRDAFEEQAVHSSFVPSVAIMAVVRSDNAQTLGHDIGAQTLIPGVSGVTQQNHRAKNCNDAECRTQHRGVAGAIDHDVWSRTIAERVQFRDRGVNRLVE